MQPALMLINFLVQTLQCTETLILYLFCTSKVWYFSKIAELFSSANQPKTTTNLQFCYTYKQAAYKDSSSLDLYTMALLLRL